MSGKKEYYIGLGDRCWKLLPIYEGIDTKGKLIFNEAEAYENFNKNLSCLIIETRGAMANFGTNSYCEQVLNLLSGMHESEHLDHVTVKSVATRCCNLCQKASEL